MVLSSPSWIGEVVVCLDWLAGGFVVVVVLFADYWLRKGFSIDATGAADVVVQVFWLVLAILPFGVDCIWLVDTLMG